IMFPKMAIMGIQVLRMRTRNRHSAAGTRLEATAKRDTDFTGASRTDHTEHGSHRKGKDNLLTSLLQPRGSDFFWQYSGRYVAKAIYLAVRSAALCRMRSAECRLPLISNSILELA